jgi:hypothetical protein
MTGYPKIQPTRWRWEDDGYRRYILYANTRKELVLLNPSASVIYAHCDGRHSCEDIIGVLAERYPKIPRETLGADFAAFMGHLIDVGSATLLARQEE